MSKREFPLFDLGSLPFAGVFSSVSPLAVGKGKWVLADNVRNTDQSLRSRWGLVKAGSAPVAVGTNATSALGTSAYPVGAKSVQCNGTVYAMSAWRTVSGPSGTWIIATDVAAGTHAIVNASSGQWGDATGIASGSYTPVDFVSIKDPRSGLEYIVCIGDTGTGVYDPTNSSFAIAANVSPPADTSGLSTKPTFPAFFTVNNASTTTWTNSDVDWAGADSGVSTTENYLTLTRSTGAASSATAQVVFSATKDLSASRQLCFLYDSAQPDFWDRVKIQVQEGAGSPSTVWDPTGTGYRPEIVPVGDTPTETKAIAAFSLDTIPAASLNAVDTIIFTYMPAAAPGAAIVANIYMIAGSGAVVGNAYHAVTLMDSASRVESIPLFPKVMPELVNNLGGPTLNNLRIPFDERLFYTYSVGYQNTATATQVNKVNIYRLDPGDADPNRYSFVATATITAYSGSWAFSSGSALSILSYTDTTASSSRNFKVLAPFPGCRAMPSGCFAGVFLNERLVLAQWKGSGSYNAPSFTQLWVSEWGNPFRFYEAPYEGDALSGGMMQTSGEVIYGLAQGSASGYGLSSLWVWTDRNVYRSFGPSVQSLLSLGLVCQHGTRYRDSIAVYRDSIFWLDYNRDVIKLSGGGLENLTRNVISDSFSTVAASSPYLINNAQAFKVSGLYFQNTYRLAYETVGSDTVSSMRKTKTFIYDDLQGEWVRDSYAGSLNNQFAFIAGDKLFGWCTDRFLYQHEDGVTTTDGGSVFSVSLTTGMIHWDLATFFAISRCSVLTDDAASGTASWTATYMPDGSTRTSGAVSIDVSTAYVYRELRAVPGAGTGKGSGPAAQIAFTFTVPGGTRIYGIKAEADYIGATPTAV